MNREKEDAAAAGPRNGADQITKAAKLSPEPYYECLPRAIYFWDRDSHSVEPLKSRQAVLA